MQQDKIASLHCTIREQADDAAAMVALLTGHPAIAAQTPQAAISYTHDDSVSHDAQTSAAIPAHYNRSQSQQQPPHVTPPTHHVTLPVTLPLLQHPASLDARTIASMSDYATRPEEPMNQSHCNSGAPQQLQQQHKQPAPLQASVYRTSTGNTAAAISAAAAERNLGSGEHASTQQRASTDFQPRSSLYSAGQAPAGAGERTSTRQRASTESQPRNSLYPKGYIAGHAPVGAARTLGGLASRHSGASQPGVWSTAAVEAILAREMQEPSAEQGAWSLRDRASSIMSAAAALKDAAGGMHEGGMHEGGMHEGGMHEGGMHDERSELPPQHWENINYRSSGNRQALADNARAYQPSLATSSSSYASTHAEAAAAGQQQHQQRSSHTTSFASSQNGTATTQLSLANVRLRDAPSQGHMPPSGGRLPPWGPSQTHRVASDQSMPAHGAGPNAWPSGADAYSGAPQHRLSAPIAHEEYDATAGRHTVHEYRTGQGGDHAKNRGDKREDRGLWQARETPDEEQRPRARGSSAALKAEMLNLDGEIAALEGALRSASGLRVSTVGR